MYIYLTVEKFENQNVMPRSPRPPAARGSPAHKITATRTTLTATHTTITATPTTICRNTLQHTATRSPRRFPGRKRKSRS